jgi:charged multivesicular body protein 7
MNSISLVVLLGSLVAAQGFLFDLSHDWNSLRVTWGFNLGWFLNKMPRTVKETKDHSWFSSKHFELKDDQCKDGNGKFVGQRFWYPTKDSKSNDSAVILIFDTKGTIAGIQTSVLKSKYNPGAPGQYFIDDGDYWTITAYFVDPSTICTAGRTSQDLSSQGTGTGLWLQFGETAASSVNIPMEEAEIKKDANWGHGKCFKSMGQHYWYQIDKNMKCDNVAPYCLLYNGGKLTGFCFAPNYYAESERYDWPAPTIKVLEKFLDPVPDCMHTDPSFAKQSTVHVFFNEHPAVTSWC